MPLGQGQLSTTPAVIYKNGGNNLVYVKVVWLHNPTDSDTTVVLYYVPNDNGQVGQAAFEWQIEEYPLAAKESYEVAPSYPWDMDTNNDSLQAKSTIANSVNYLVLGKAT